MANILVKKNEDQVIVELCKLIEKEAKDAIARSGTFHLGLSGGSLATFLCRGLPSISTDWSAWRLFFCDERLVAAESPDSTWGVYRSGLLQKTPLTEEQFLVVKTGLEPEAAACEYQGQIVNQLSSRLDLLLLGAGPDGHTCSLFPNHALLQEPNLEDGGRIVAHITDSPKPPPQRVTLTLPAINNAQSCAFAACGAGKADMMARLLAKEKEGLPAQLVLPKSGNLHWILDEAAAAKMMLSMIAK